MSTLERQIERGFAALAESCASIVEDDLVDKDAALAETMGQAQEYFAKLVDDATGVVDKRATPSTSAYDELMQLAVELRKAEPKLSEAQAFARVHELNPRLAKAEREERRSTVAKSTAAERLAERAAAVRKLHPNIGIEDTIARVKACNGELVKAFQHERAVASTDPFDDMQKGGSSVVANRVHARAAALVRQFNLTADEAIQRVLQSNPEMAAALDRE